jgi:phosphoglycolate/pyridoxal phosphate phosphatase family enzyme
MKLLLSPSILLLTMLSPAVSFLVRVSCRQSTRLFATTSTQSVTDIMMEDAMRETQTLVKHYASAATTAPTIWTSREDAASFVKKYVDAILFDCDGVLYRGYDKSPDASEALKTLLGSGKQCFFVTNNAAANRQQLQAKLSKMMDCPELTVDQMIGSTYACSRYLENNLPADSNVHVIGSQGLCDEISQAGFKVTGGPSEGEKADMSREELADYDFPDHPIDAVCMGLDTAFTYRKLAIANVLLQRNPNAILVSTNQDAFDLVGSDGRHLPGNGCLVKALEHGSKRTAINVGKPSSVLAEMIIRENNLDPARTMFVGDRLDTDIKFGKESGMISVLVMSGVTTAEIVISLGEEGTVDEPIPQIIMPVMGMLA